MTPPERRYRSTLRLLPVGYRQIWEEDMVDAYMESASRHGGDAPSARSWAEHLSVFGLAVRLRLSGAHASPRGLAWRAALHGFALVALLYTALSGVVTVTTLVVESLPPASYDPTTTAALLSWPSAIATLLWVAAFAAMVLGRVTAARLLVLVGFFAQVGLMTANLLSEVRPYVQDSASLPGIRLVWRQAVELSVANGVWLAIVTAATLIAAEAGSSKPGRKRRFWLGGAALLAIVLVAAEVVESAAYPIRLHVNLVVAVHLGLLLAMVAVLALRRSPRWLLALALFVLVFAGGELLDYVRYILDGRSVGQVYFSPPSYWQRVDVGLMALAVGCAVVGVIGLRRLPRVQPSAARA